jgi:hypothetical protein
MLRAQPERAPWFCLWAVKGASWLAPKRDRLSFAAHWEGNIRALCVLAERGEFVRSAAREMADLCRRALAEAFWMRVSREGLREFARGPMPVFACAAAALAAIGIASGGFLGSSYLLGSAAAALRGLETSAQQNTLVGHGVTLGFALVIGISAAKAAGLPPRALGWRYMTYYVLKVLAVACALSLIWIESGAAVRRLFGGHPARGFFGGLLPALVFLGAFGRSIYWATAEQRLRCPVCLKRLAMPVALGSWASVIDPAQTEMLCEDGHGALCMPESEIGAEERWIRLDASWGELFESKAGRG